MPDSLSQEMEVPSHQALLLLAARNRAKQRLNEQVLFMMNYGMWGVNWIFLLQTVYACIESLFFHFSFGKLPKAFLAGNFLKLFHWFPKVLRGFQQNNPVGFVLNWDKANSVWVRVNYIFRQCKQTNACVSYFYICHYYLG